jgi:hypothetical protein
LLKYSHGEKPLETFNHQAIAFKLADMYVQSYCSQIIVVMGQRARKMQEWTSHIQAAHGFIIIALQEIALGQLM